MSTLEQETNEDNFDDLILLNFVPFSGRQNVEEWLHETENKFTRFCIGRSLRYAAISLLVEGDAKRKYIKKRKEIRSFDDFYEFLLSEFEFSVNLSSQKESREVVTNNLFEPIASSRVTVTNDSNQSVSNNNDNNNTFSLSGGTPAFNSTAPVNLSDTKMLCKKPVMKSTVGPSGDSVILDQTINDLRKAIVDNLIKNPKTFRGDKDDVKKWIEEIEHLLDVAHIPESTRLDLISYSLRGDALEWFKNNRSLFTSWSVFVSELNRAFTSSFYEELAFKKLESYTQGENQSIRSFFNEVLKLCKDADGTMSEATKLKNLLNKAKPSIQFEVRKNKPNSTAQFLEYAKEAEELIQLSNMFIGNPNSNNNTQLVKHNSIPSLVSNLSAPMNQLFDNALNNFLPAYARNFDHNS